MIDDALYSSHFGRSRARSEAGAGITTLLMK